MMLVRSLLVAVVLVGCGEDTSLPSADVERGSDAAATVVADQATLPQTEADEHIGVATTTDERDAQWARFGMNGSPSPVDFAGRVLLFAGFGESGSCPYVFDGVAVDGKTMRLRDAQDQVECTDDYNPRTVVFSIDREVLPEGFITVDMPAGAADAVISLPESAEPPPATLDAVNPSVADVDLVVEPQSVPVGDKVTVQMPNTTEQDRIRTPPWVTIHRWTGYHFEAVGEIDPGGDIMEAGPGETVELMTVSTADPVFAAGPGWFRVTAPSLHISGEDPRMLDAHGNLQLVEE